MKTTTSSLAAALCSFLLACGGGSSRNAPGSPTEVGVAPGDSAGAAVVSFAAPASSGSGAITGYTGIMERWRRNLRTEWT